MWAAPDPAAAAVDPTTILLVAVVTGLLTALTQISVAFITRATKAKETPAPNLDLVEDLDHINDHLMREMRRLTAERDDAVRRAEAAEEQLRKRPRR